MDAVRTQRYHSLDALRAAMMLLGLVLHAGASYTPSSLGDAWPYQDVSTAAPFEGLLFVIHVFRMPVFFLAAGFFGALLWERDGPAGFLLNRAKRVLLPLIVFWIPLSSLVALGFLVALVYGRGLRAQDLIAEYSGRPEISLMHLWFLWYLVWFYAAAWIILQLGRQSGAALPARAMAALTTAWWSPVVWVAVTTVTLLPMPYPGIETSATILPAARSLFAYGVFFAFGWLLYHARDRLDAFGAFCTWRRLVAMLAGAGVLFALVVRPFEQPVLVSVAGRALMSVVTWTLVLAIAGSFVKYVHRERAVVRYISDAAYWIYLVHLPVVIWMAGLLGRQAWPAYVKFAIVLGVTAVVCSLSYHYLVRSTAIGQLLNGRRHPRALPASRRALGKLSSEMLRSSKAAADVRQRQSDGMPP